MANLDKEESEYRRKLPQEHSRNTASKLFYAPGSGNKREAKEALGAGGGASGPRSNSGFGRWLQRYERRKETMLTVPSEPNKPTPETTTPKSVTGAADIELAQTIGETKNIEERKELEADQRKHLLFRTHRYLPSMTTPRNAPESQRPQIEPGAYRRETGRGHGLVNMANDPDLRN